MPPTFSSASAAMMNSSNNNNDLVLVPLIPHTYSYQHQTNFSASSTTTSTTTTTLASFLEAPTPPPPSSRGGGGGGGGGDSVSSSTPPTDALRLGRVALWTHHHHHMRVSPSSSTATATTSWAKKYLPRQFLALQAVRVVQQNNNHTEGGRTTTLDPYAPLGLAVWVSSSSTYPLSGLSILHDMMTPLTGDWVTGTDPGIRITSKERPPLELHHHPGPTGPDPPRQTPHQSSQTEPAWWYGPWIVRVGEALQFSSPRQNHRHQARVAVGEPPPPDEEPLVFQLRSVRRCPAPAVETTPPPELGPRAPFDSTPRSSTPPSKRVRTDSTVVEVQPPASPPLQGPPPVEPFLLPSPQEHQHDLVTHHHHQAPQMEESHPLLDRDDGSQHTALLAAVAASPRSPVLTPRPETQSPPTSSWMPAPIWNTGSPVETPPSPSAPPLLRKLRGSLYLGGNVPEAMDLPVTASERNRIAPINKSEGGIMGSSARDEHHRPPSSGVVIPDDVNNHQDLTIVPAAESQVANASKSGPTAGPDEQANENGLQPDSLESVKKYVLFFVEKGTDMTGVVLHGNQQIEGLKRHVQGRGAVVLDHFDRNKPETYPNFFVVSEKPHIRTEDLARQLGFADADEWAGFMGEHNIKCVTRSWAARGNRVDKPPLQEPSRMELYWGVWPKKDQKNSVGEAPTSPLASARRQQIMQDSPAALDSQDKSPTRPVGKGRNEDLSLLFQRLSKLHQACPLLEFDDWKAYTFHILSGRVRHLDFEITKNPESMAKLKCVKGFGASSLQIVEEYVETGKCRRLDEFETNPLRVAMKTFMNIWGVGRVRASELVHAGYRTIKEVREAVDARTLCLDRNQYIGLQCYEDILEEMEHKEVEAIFEIVQKTFKKRYPLADLSLMGSYRRGKPLCGDADILVTHPNYYDRVPPQALGHVVDDLRVEGVVAHHLTFISGMDPDRFETLPSSVASFLTNPRQYGRSRERRDKYSSSTYFGVFYSPLYPGKRRRVDIKFYPKRQQIFATLYFTGNGHFNRSMRLWATRKFNYTLSDHGLFERDTEVRVMEASTERQVFERLGLMWKEPHERDCFDAVQSSDPTREPIDEDQVEMTRHELLSEEQQHAWVE